MADQKTEKILAAAERLVLANGLRATTMEAIAREAGVAKPTLYGRFSDKETVFRAVVSRRLAELRGRFSEALEAPGPAPERVGRALSAKIVALHDLLSASPHAAEILDAQEALNGQEHQALFDWTRGEIARVLVAEGMAGQEAERRALIVTAAVDGLKSQDLFGERLGENVAFIARRLLA